MSKLTDGIRNILVGTSDELDGIVQGFQTTISRLVGYADRKNAEAVKLSEEAAKLLSERELRKTSAERANRIAAKLKDILD